MMQFLSDYASKKSLYYNIKNPHHSLHIPSTLQVINTNKMANPIGILMKLVIISPKLTTKSLHPCNDTVLTTSASWPKLYQFSSIYFSNRCMRCSLYDVGPLNYFFSIMSTRANNSHTFSPVCKSTQDSSVVLSLSCPVSPCSSSFDYNFFFATSKNICLFFALLSSFNCKCLSNQHPILKPQLLMRVTTTEWKLALV